MHTVHSQPAQVNLGDTTHSLLGNFSKLWKWTTWVSLCGYKLVEIVCLGRRLWSILCLLMLSSSKTRLIHCRMICWLNINQLWQPRSPLMVCSVWTCLNFFEREVWCYRITFNIIFMTTTSFIVILLPPSKVQSYQPRNAHSHSSRGHHPPRP
jgi:hypothetical protein